MNEYRVETWKTTGRDGNGVSACIRRGHDGHMELLHHFQLPEKHAASVAYTLRLQEVVRALNMPLSDSTPLAMTDRERQAHRDWYVRVVGYDPVSDDPDMTDDDLRELVAGFAAQAGVPGVVLCLPFPGPRTADA